MSNQSIADNNHITKQSQILDAPYYITCIDTFMSGWGRAEGKSNKIIFVCKNKDQAYAVESNCEYRDEIKYVRWIEHKPAISPNQYTQLITDEIYQNWYKQKYFRNTSSI